MLQLVNDNNQRLMASMQQQLAWQKSFEEQMDRHVEVRAKWVNEMNERSREMHELWPKLVQASEQARAATGPAADVSQMPPLEPRQSSSSSSDEFEDSNAEWDEPDPPPPTKDKQD